MRAPSWHEGVAGHLVAPRRLDKAWSPAIGRWQAAGVPSDGGSDGPTLAELATPVFTVDVEAVRHNLTAMHGWAAEHGVVLAPHGKTTMTPGLWAWQLAAGAWGITVANEFQLRVARDAGVRRIVCANELISASALSWLAAELDGDEAFDVVCWADSPATVETMTRRLAEAGASRPVGVCVELGMPGGRTGARSVAELIEVARAVVRSPLLQLRGVAGYEGSSPADTAAGRERDVVAYLSELSRAFLQVAELAESPEPLLSAGGSAYFDLVAEIAGPVVGKVPGARVVLRSGCYLVHDDGVYRSSTPAVARGSGPLLRPAAHVWARVLSVPTPTRALLDAGRRDVSYDAGLPEPQLVWRASADRVSALTSADGAASTMIADQHLYVDLASSGALPGALAVDDVVRLGLSHPCTTFDKWRTVLLVDRSDDPRLARVLGALATWF